MTVQLKAGELPHRVTVMEKISTTAANAYGERTPSFREVIKIWAKVRPVSARESERAKSFGEAVAHAVDIRYRTGLHAGMQLTHRGRTFLVNGITDADEEKVKMTLFCSELPAGV